MIVSRVDTNGQCYTVSRADLPMIRPTPNWPNVYMEVSTGRMIERDSEHSLWKMFRGGGE